MAKIWAAAASSSFLPTKRKTPVQWITAILQVAGRKSPWESVRGGKNQCGTPQGWRGSDQSRRVCGVAKDPEERGVHPGLGGRGVKDLKNPQRVLMVIMD